MRAGILLTAHVEAFQTFKDLSSISDHKKKWSLFQKPFLSLLEIGGTITLQLIYIFLDIGKTPDVVA